MKTPTVLLCVALLLTAAVSAGAQEYVWVEGERPARASFEWSAAGAEQSALLSGERWLLPKERVNLPDAGYLVEYDVEVAAGGEYELWLRVGFEWIRAQVAWRFDEGEWTHVGIGARLTAEQQKKVAGRPKPDLDRPTTNLKYVGLWNEVAWWDVGRAQLAAGKRRLRLRFSKTHIDNPMIAVDAICLVRGKWTPEGKLKPGETYSGEAEQRAAQQVYKLPAPADDAARSEVTLSGPWQAARYDDADMDVDTLKPVARIPAPDEYDLKWLGVEIPSYASRHPELKFGQRLIFRTKIDVPAACAGRAFKLHFSGTNWIVSIFVNGQYAGDHRGVWIPWDLDVTRFVQVGKVNEIAVAVKGSYYAFDPRARGDAGVNMRRNLPPQGDRLQYSRWIAPIYPSSKGDGEGAEYGIVNPVKLVAMGQAYVEDVFIKPSVQRKELVTDVTVRNTTDRAQDVRVVCEAVNDRDGKVEQTFGPVALSVPAGASALTVVKGAWAEPKLWWPLPEPNLYRLRTKVSLGGKVVDTQEELFGFREVTVDGPAVKINGVRRNFWNWVDVKDAVGRADDYERSWRDEGDRFLRMSHGRRLTRVLRTREERLEYYDRKGMAGRLCSMIDGMFITFDLLDGDGPNEPVWENFREHVAQLTRAYRNHPSVIMYQIENELVYINGMNTTGNRLPIVEREMLKVYEAGKAHDPTRPYTVGGGGDCSKAEGLTDPARTLEINCPHYPTGDLGWYPDNAYTLEQYATKITRWPWTREKPWVVGESSHANSLEYGTYVAGPAAFRSQDDADRAKAKYLRMLYGGYRWAGVAGFFPWDNLARYEDGRKTFSDLCVIPRKQTHRLYAGRENRLLFKVMNDTFSKAPVTFEWSYELAGKRVAGETINLDIEPGHGLEQTLTIAPPAVAKRTEGVLTLKARQPGAADFVDVRSVPALAPVAGLRVAAPVTLFDPSGKVEAFMKDAGVSYKTIGALAEAKDKTGLLVIGPDALSAREARGQDLLAFAARGGRVLALEQEHPVSGGNLAAPVKTTRQAGGYAHPQALGTPLFRELGREDLIDWAGEHPVYKNAYLKPRQGARSLVECGPTLPHSALVEMAAGRGMLMLCQLRVGAKLRQDPAADVMFRNLLERCASYKPPNAVAAIYAPGNQLLARKLEETGVLQETVGGIEAALDAAKFRVAVVDATRQNVAALNRLKAKADVFQRAGGWLMLCGVRPESIDGFNQLAGVDHLLRPFRLERDHMQDTDTPLAATIGDGDVMLYGTEWIARWMGRRWVSGDTLSYVIDGDDAGPFTYPPGATREPYAYQALMSDKDPYNFVNGMLGSDFWKYIQQIWLDDGGPKPLEFAVRRPETIREVRIWNNTNYGTIENLEVIFDGDDARPVKLTLPDAGDMVAAKLDPPRTAQKSIALQIRSWRAKPETNRQPRLVGIDNVQFLRAKRPSRGVFLDRAGGLVAFPQGPGGIFLNQIKFMENEPWPENAGKKVALLNTLLQNMGVGARTAAVAAPGVNVRFETLDITDYCNHFMTARDGKPGWFGRKGQDLAQLPLGKRNMGDVTFHVVDYNTAPVPDCIVLGGLRNSPPGLAGEVKGIKVGKKADVLFFLQAANVTRRIGDRDRARIGAQRNPFILPEVARYVLHYADGRTAEIPVILEKHVDHWLSPEPQPLDGAQLAWSAPLENVKDAQAALYGMKVMNPRPDVAIAAIDVLPGQDEKGDPADRAVPALLAITLGTIEE